MNRHATLDGRAVGLMASICAIFALQQIAIKAAGPDMAPMLQVAIRSGGGALLAGVYLRAKGMGLLPGRGRWLAALVVGLLSMLEFYFIAEGLRFTSASRLITMLYTAPAFAALGLHVFIPEERLRSVQWGGMALAFCGVVLAIHGSGASGEAMADSMLWGDLLGLMAGVSWGASTVIIRMKLAGTPAMQTTFVQLLASFCILLPGAALTGQFDFAMTGMVWVSLIFQILIVCGGMLVWFWLLTAYPASQLGALSFLTPVFGIVFGVLLLGEAVEPQFIAGSALVLSGIGLVSGWEWFLRHVLRHASGLQWIRARRRGRGCSSV